MQYNNYNSASRDIPSELIDLAFRNERMVENTQIFTPAAKEGLENFNNVLKTKLKEGFDFNALVNFYDITLELLNHLPTGISKEIRNLYRFSIDNKLFCLASWLKENWDKILKAESKAQFVAPISKLFRPIAIDDGISNPKGEAPKEINLLNNLDINNTLVNFSSITSKNLSGNSKHQLCKVTMNPRAKKMRPYDRNCFFFHAPSNTSQHMQNASTQATVNYVL